MKINTKTRYGLRTLLELALNNDNRGGIYQKEIAERQNISNRYLDHIIASDQLQFKPLTVCYSANS